MPAGLLNSIRNKTENELRVHTDGFISKGKYGWHVFNLSLHVSHTTTLLYEVRMCRVVTGQKQSEHPPLCKRCSGSHPTMCALETEKLRYCESRTG